MRLSDSKKMLADILQCEITDTVAAFYEKKDKENENLIKFEKGINTKLTKKVSNLEQEVTNLEDVVKNKDTEIAKKDKIIQEQKNEIIKQKILKIAGFTGSVVLPVVTALLLLK